ncbi:MAG: hypothetical protein NUK63_09405 [Candidatus Bathyarchaeum tardum]|nr:MAG: hypothetical protein NUK63_09405 [Candidatus Bathyarchaeum tardum]
MMADVKLVVIMSICIVLAIGCIGAGVMIHQKEAEVALKVEEIFEIKHEKSSLESQLSGLVMEKTSLEFQVSDLELQTTELNNDVFYLQSQVSSLEIEVSGLEVEVVQNYDLGYFEGQSAGYETGYEEGYSEGLGYMAENGYSTRNPTYQEALLFISSDLTDRNLYTDGYVCYDFTADFNYNAEQQGYRCGFVYMTFSSGAHAIACFETTDRGLIYIEPQTDEIVNPAVGKMYNGEIIQSLGIIW